MSMPEVAVNEHNNFPFWKNEIRVSKNCLVPAPAFYMQLSKLLNHAQFSGSVTR